jgi:hypothetical protein
LGVTTQWGEPPDLEYMDIFCSNGLVRKDSNFISPTRESIDAVKNVSLKLILTIQKWKNSVPNVGYYNPKDVVHSKSPKYTITSGKLDRLALPKPSCTSNINPELLID